MSRSEGHLLCDINILLAGSTESLAWLQFGWLWSQAWSHYVENGDELCAAGPKPKLASPGWHPLHWPWRRIPAWTASRDTDMPTAVGAWTCLLETHSRAFWPAAVLTARMSVSPVSLEPTGLGWAAEGRVRRMSRGLSGIVISGSRWP